MIIIFQVDVDGDGTVDFVEFLHMMAEQKKEMLQTNNNNNNNNNNNDDDCDDEGEMKQAFDMYIIIFSGGRRWRWYG